MMGLLFVMREVFQLYIGFVTMGSQSLVIIVFLK
jgi:hypothetical protein